MGDTRFDASTLPIQAQTPPDVQFVDVAAGLAHIAAVGDDGNIYSWGDNSYGHLGTGSRGGYLDTPTKTVQGDLPPGEYYIKVQAGANHTVALTNRHNVYAWGWNEFGQLGKGHLRDAYEPTRVLLENLPAGEYYSDIVAANVTSAALTNKGNMYAWGGNSSGQLGDGTVNSVEPWGKTRPVKVLQGDIPADEHVTAMGMGAASLLAVTDKGNLYTWGENAHGQLGDGTHNNRRTPGKIAPNVLPPDEHFIYASSEYETSAAITDKGNLYTWGDNNRGQLGDGTHNDRSIPGKIETGDLPAGEHYISSVFGVAQGLAVTNRGTVMSWGRNDIGQLGAGDTVDHSTPVRTRKPKYIIDSVTFDGSTVGHKDFDQDTGVMTFDVPERGPGTIEVIVSYHTAGVIINGTILEGPTRTATLHYTYAPIYDVNFELGEATGSTNSPSPDAQYVFSDDPQPILYPSFNPTWSGHWFIGWTAPDGKLWDFHTPVTSNMTLTAKWESYQFKLDPNSGPTIGGNTVSVIAPNSPQSIVYTSVSAGYEHSVAIGSDGNTYAWGSNTSGQLGDGSTSSHSALPVRVATPSGVRFVSVSAGKNHTLALGTDNNLYAWGDNTYGQLGDGSNTSRNTPIQVNRITLPAGHFYMDISAGWNHNIAISSNRKTFTWGNNDHGQLGDGSNTNRNKPVRVSQGALPMGQYFASVSAGGSHTAAIDSDNLAYAWGDNAQGQIGNGTTNDSNAPVQVSQGDLPAGERHTAISAGTNHTLTLASNNEAYAWGNNDHGQLGDGSNTDRNAPVQVSRGTLPAGEHFTSISAGGWHSVALSSNNAIYAWGRNDFGQLGDGANADRNAPDAIAQGALPAGQHYTNVSAGGTHTVANVSNKHTGAWGHNNTGQLGNDSDLDHNVSVQVGLQKLVVTAVEFDQVEVSPAPVWDGDNQAWNVKPQAHLPGRVDVSIHWTLGGVAYDNYPLSYTYLMPIPSAGSIPLYRLGGGVMIGLTIFSSLTIAGYQLSRKHKRAGKHGTIAV
ncbi:hypothetical protein KIMH_10150 [Bombiscardovia apis]|uniref:RCC1-like domain-containing protein n=2 Tax=Bombiscardovia apis TaxID=2932182 RepID=A0ABN6SFV1_9BIFI|nr:hypothetical protein KIMH_10150 [Bombiscardovia apis]